MEHSGEEPKQEAKPAVDGIAQNIKAKLEYVSVPGSPDGGGSSRGWQTASSSTAAAASASLPPPRTPEKRKISAAMSPERSPALHDRRASAAANSGVPGTPTKSGDEIAADAAAMPPPPTTPKRRGRRALPRSKTPAKPRTPKGGLTALRMGQGGEDEEDGEEQEEKLTPSKEKLRGPSRTLEMTPTKKVKGRAFGRAEDGSPCKDRVAVPAAVSRVYSIVQKATGSVGGNGNSGAIYGELTVGCMQKVVNVLKEETGFDTNSSFIDVGSGLGKPNFHVAQDPGCEISYGLELEEVRWQLSVVNHRSVLRDGVADRGVNRGGNGSVTKKRGVDVQKHNLFFAHGDILSAKSFDPFTHVYMFDIGFPPDTLRKIAQIFNNSQARHLISYQVPKKVLDYGFKVDNILKMPLSLTGSGEGHTMYLYRRKYVEHGLAIDRIMQVDPFFEEGVSLCRDGGDGSSLANDVERKFEQNTSGGIRTRSRSRSVQS